MNDISDSFFLKELQYKTSENLSKRAKLHHAFGSNPLPWQQWLVGQMFSPPRARILDLGSGPGYFWIENSKTLPAGANVYLTDISGGMLEESRASLRGETWFFYTQVDAQEIPFPGGFFDIVIANHMLYHVRELKVALREVRRVLRPGGYLYAATNGREHLVELRNLEKILPGGADIQGSFWEESFNLENGQELLTPYFEEVDCQRYPNRLLVTEPTAILEYLVSKSTQEIEPEKLSGIKHYLEGEIAKHGKFTITSDAGLFRCRSS